MEEPRLAAPPSGSAAPEYAYAPVISELFISGNTDSTDIDANDVLQDQLGDCFFLAGVAAVARANPEAIRSLFTNNHDGTYTVRLYANREWKTSKQITLKSL